jgi:multiple sugar transport system substrate-binding protein
VRVQAVLLAAALALAPLDARAADLTVWWEEGYYPEESQAIRETVAAFERKTGKAVDLTLAPYTKLRPRALAALEDGHPPDFLFGLNIEPYHARWAHEGRLVDLADAVGPFADQFGRDALDHATLLDATSGRRGLYALPVARSANHVHVWTSLLERAGLTLADVPREWEPFWSFWCEKVQPAVRGATGRDDVWGIGLPMGAGTGADDTDQEFGQFVAAYEADYVTRDGRLVIDEPLIRGRLAKALDSYAAFHRRGCTPPDAIDWNNYGNNRAFLTQAVVMTPNLTLSITNELRAERPEDYYKNTATIAWPTGAYGQPLAIWTRFDEAVVFEAGGHVATAEEFVRFLVGGGWLAHWLDFAGDRLLPPMPALLEQPFWLDPSDPHRMASAMQFLTRPHTYSYAVVSGEWRHSRVTVEGVWPKAVHRVVADGFSPEQAIDEAITRIHQLLSE